MPTAAKRGGLRSLPPAPRQSSGFPTASASLSFPGCGRTCAAKRRRRAGTSSARKTRSRRIASSMPLTASGTTGSRTAGCRTFLSRTCAAAAATCSRPRLTSRFAPNEITLIDRAKGAIAVVSKGWDRGVEAPLRWSADASAIHCLAQDRARQHLFRFDLASRAPTALVKGGMVTEFDLAGDAVAFIRDEMSHPPAVYARRGDGAERKAESFNDALLRRFQLGASEELSFRGWGGETVQMWLVFPPRFDPKKRYPLLHSIHGGPHAISADSWHFRWNNHAFAAQGYIVAGVNFHGSSSFAQEFIEFIRHEFGKRELADIEAATALLSKRRYVDRKRVFASGGSYGGYLVAWMNGRVPQGRYRAYVCHAGCFDWVSMFADDSYPFFAKELGAWYWEDFGKVEAQNPRAAVKRMQTPTLVIHGAPD